MKQSNYDHTLQTKVNKDELSSEQEQSQQKIKQPISRGKKIFRYQIFFYGYCYYCSNFGHKAANCGIKFRSMQLRRSHNEQWLQHRTKQ